MDSIPDPSVQLLVAYILASRRELGGENPSGLLIPGSTTGGSPCRNNLLGPRLKGVAPLPYSTY